MSTCDKNNSSALRVTGRVKWFNNKRGFGFITALTGDTVGVDVFAHHSSINTSNEQYVYLLQGEYVDFVMQLVGENESAPRWEASAITGFGGGKLMCETRFEARHETLHGGSVLNYSPHSGHDDVRDDVCDDGRTNERSYGRGQGRGHGRGRGQGRGRGRGVN